MSDDFGFVLMMTEGTHDVETIARILKIMGYRELRKERELPEELTALIPRKYPFQQDGTMDFVVPRPTFLVRDEKYVVVKGTGGLERISERLAETLLNFRGGILKTLRCIAIIADMDCDQKPFRVESLIRQIDRALDGDGKVDRQEETGGFIAFEEVNIPFRIFLFPDNDSPGTLEQLLLDGAGMAYPDLLANAENYIEKVKELYRLKPYNDQKAKVGVVANVLKPGRATQVSIHDNDWFTNQSLRDLPTHARFAAFLDEITSMM